MTSYRYLLTLFLCFFAASQGFAYEQSSNVKLKWVLEQHIEEDMEESILKVAPLLMSSQILLPRSKEIEESEEGKRELTLLTASDKFGRLWFYGYTDEVALLEAFPEGMEYFTMAFTDFFKTTQSHENLGGIFINSASKSAYPISTDLFEPLKEAKA